MPSLLVNSSSRGTDATGVAFIKRGLNVIKGGIVASKFIHKKKFLKTFDDPPQIMIGHTRLKTQGASTNNKNNHPVFNLGLAVVHNGTVWNDDNLYDLFKLKRDAKVDSEIIVKLVEHFIKQGKTPNKAIKLAINRMRGSITTALIHDKSPRTLFLTKISNPLWLALHKPTGNIYFASTRAILKKSLFAARKIKNYFKTYAGRGEYIFQEVADETMLKITPQLIKEQDIEAATWQSANKNNGWETYYQKKGKKKALPKPKKQAFSLFDSISKPSEYTNGELVLRLERIFQMTKDLRFNKSWETEIKRIINMLETRNQLSKIHGLAGYKKKAQKLFDELKINP